MAVEVFAAFWTGFDAFTSASYLPFLAFLSVFSLAAGFNRRVSRPADPGLGDLIPADLPAYLLGFGAFFLVSALPAWPAGRWAWSLQEGVRLAGGGAALAGGLYSAVFSGPSGPKAARVRFFESGGGGFIIFAFLVGAGAAASWSPEIGRRLMAITIFAATQGGHWSGAFLLAVFTAGLLVPSLLIGLTLHTFVFMLPAPGRLVEGGKRIFSAALAGAGLVLAGGGLASSAGWMLFTGGD